MLKIHPADRPASSNVNHQFTNEIASASLPRKEEEESFDERANMYNSVSPKRMDKSNDESPVKGRAKTTAHEYVRNHSGVFNNQDIIEKQPAWVFQEEELPKFPTDTQTLRVLVVTWNLFGKKPKGGLEELFNINKTKHHIISVGTEECLRSISASTFYESKSQWINMLRHALDKDYVMLKSHSMNALHLTVFAHKDIFSLVRDIESDEVRTGFGKVVGNKGGIGISLRIAKTSLLFVNCHLASGQKQEKRRNEDFEAIFKGLELPKSRVAQEKKAKQKSNVVERFDAIFWSGDFNYRVNQTKDTTIQFLKEQKFNILLEQDQFIIERPNNRVLNNFKEGEIKFLPTYKYQPGSQSFDNKKNRTPSWTDRIIYYNNAEKATLSQMNYESFQSITLSDHRPVFSQFTLTLEGASEEAVEEGLIKLKTKVCNIF